MSAQLRQRGDDDVLAHGEPAEQLVDLVALGQAELAHVGDVHAGDVAPLEHDAAGGRRDLAGQHLEEGRLAGAVGPDDAAQLALVDGEIDVAVGDEAAIALGQAGCAQDRSGTVAARRRGEPAPGRGADCLAISASAAFCSASAVRPDGASSTRRLGVLAGEIAVEVDKPADDAAAQEADQQHEDDAEHELPCRAEAERRLQEVLQKQPDGGADQRSEQRAAAADRGLHHELAGGVEHERVRRHEGLQHAEQAAGKAGIGGGDHEGGQLVAVDVVADRGGAQRIVADRAEDRADRRAHDAQRDHDADEIAERDELVERPAIGEVQRGEAEIEARRRHARQPVLAAGVVRQRIELDEEEHLGDRDRDHGEVDAGAPQRDQADQVAGDGGGDHADDQRADHVAEAGAGQQIGGDEAAGAVKRRLAERQQSGEAEQDVEAEAEQAPDQDAVHGVRREAEMRAARRATRSAPIAVSVSIRKGRCLSIGSFIRGPARRAGRAAAAPARASSPQTASHRRSRG